MQTADDCPGDDAVADVQFVHAGNFSNGQGVVVVQAVAGVYHQAEFQCQRSGFTDALQLLLLSLRGFRIGVVAGVDFNGRGTTFTGGTYLRRICINEQGHINAGLPQRRAALGNPGLIANHIQSSFCGQFLALFRHQTAMRRLDPRGDGNHLFGGRHFQIHACLQRLRQQLHVPVIDMTTILTQVNGNPVRPCLLRHQRRLHRLRITGATRLTQGGNVIDINAEKDSGHEIHLKRFYEALRAGTLGMFF